MKRVRKQKAGMSMPYAVSFGVGVAVILSAILVAVLAALVSKESLTFDTGKITIPVIQFLSTFVGCLIVGSSVRDNKVAGSCAVCGVYYLLLIGVSALVMDGIAAGFWSGLLSSLIGCLGSIFLCMREKTQSRGGKRKRVYN